MPLEQASTLRVVARFLDGRMLKGTTRDFSPIKPDFHVQPDGDLRAAAIKASISQLKAVFFVKTLEGDKNHVESQKAATSVGQGRAIRITFKDGEVILGSTVGYTPNRPGFFLVPMDPDSNNLRIFVCAAGISKVEFISSSQPNTATSQAP